MIAIVDYGVGNLFSLESSFRAVGAEVCVTRSEKDLQAAEKIVLPGVGAFEDAVRKLAETGLDKVLQQQAANGKPILGICLGMQMLFDVSYEFGTHRGLGLIPGEICPIAQVIPRDLKIPQIGWNALEFPQGNHPLWQGIEEGDYVYFVHSFYAKCDPDYVIARTEYGAMLTAAVARGNVMGCQFHPEKSGKVGLAILKAFCDMEVKVC